MMDHSKTDKDITLRDYFAAKAMQGLMSINPDMLIPMTKDGEKISEFVVRISYQVANLMMKERMKDESST